MILQQPWLLFVQNNPVFSAAWRFEALTPLVGAVASLIFQILIPYLVALADGTDSRDSLEKHVRADDAADRPIVGHGFVSFSNVYLPMLPVLNWMIFEYYKRVSTALWQFVQSNSSKDQEARLVYESAFRVFGGSSLHWSFMFTVLVSAIVSIIFLTRRRARVAEVAGRTVGRNDWLNRAGRLRPIAWYFTLTVHFFQLIVILSWAVRAGVLCWFVLPTLVNHERLDVARAIAHPDRMLGFRSLGDVVLYTIYVALVLFTTILLWFIGQMKREGGARNAMREPGKIAAIFAFSVVVPILGYGALVRCQDPMDTVRTNALALVTRTGGPEAAALYAQIAAISTFPVSQTAGLTAIGVWLLMPVSVALLLGRGTPQTFALSPEAAIDSNTSPPGKTTLAESDQSVMREDRLPPARANNFMYHRGRGDTAIVFVHGIFSDSRTCWLREENPRQYWPELILSDSRFGDSAVYLGGFYTETDSGDYDLADCAEELGNSLMRPGADGTPSLLQSYKRVFFVCHSTGGIVVRYLLDAWASEFNQHSIGLALIASPAFGSRLANYAHAIAQLYGQRLGLQLRVGDYELRDIHERFQRLVKRRTPSRLYGAEAHENRAVVHCKWLPRFLRVVTPASASPGYWGSPVNLGGKDHFTAVKPTGRSDRSHTFVVDTWLGFLAATGGAAGLGEWKYRVDERQVTEATIGKSDRSSRTISDIRFKVAVSFDGEHRPFVKAVATVLREQLGPDELFYDLDYQSQLARPNLDTLLQDIYLHRSDLVVVFLGAEYAKRQWCGLEWRAVRDIVKAREDERVMFVRFDDVDVRGVFSIDGYIDARKHDPAAVARFVLDRLRTLAPTTSIGAAHAASPPVTQPLAATPLVTAHNGLSVTLDPRDPNCVDLARGGRSFAIRVEKVDAGHLDEVSLVLAAAFVDYVQQARPPGSRFVLAGPKERAYSTRLNPQVPTYFQLFYDRERADRQEEGKANWQLSLEAEREDLSGKHLELQVRIASPLLTPLWSVVFRCTENRPFRLVFERLTQIDRA